MITSNSAGPHTRLSLTHNETNLAVLIIITTSHHGPNCVIHHGHNVNVKVLREIKGPSSAQVEDRCEDRKRERHHASMPLTQSMATHMDRGGDHPRPPYCPFVFTNQDHFPTATRTKFILLPSPHRTQLTQPTIFCSIPSTHVNHAHIAT